MRHKTFLDLTLLIYKWSNCIPTHLIELLIGSSEITSGKLFEKWNALWVKLILVLTKALLPFALGWVP